MAHEFVIMRNGILETYDDYNQIPLDFQHIIRFIPEIPPGPHTLEEHEEIESWNHKFQKLVQIERINNQR